MLFLAIVCFSLAAILGLLLISFVLTNRPTPKGVAFTHGFFAASGIILLLIFSFMHPTPPIIPLAIFVLAALGGFILIYRDLTGKTLPKWLAVTHGLVAVTAFVCLLIYTVKMVNVG